MKILITGGAGYIAKKVAESLKEHDVTLLTRADLDLADENACRIFFYNKAYDVIIHNAI